MKNRYRTYLSSAIALLMLSSIPVFAQVTSLQTDSDYYYKGGKVTFSGTVQEGTAGLVTIVINDPNDEFVKLVQTVIDYDYSFEKTTDVGDKFSKHGVYNATGFILNMTNGVTTNFGVSLNGSPIILNDDSVVEEPVVEEPVVEEPVVEEPVVEEPVVEEPNTSITPSFVDPKKDPQHYIDRYYNEPIYKTWFDEHFPELTIEETVGYTDNKSKIEPIDEQIIDEQIIPNAEALSMTSPVLQSNTNSEIVQFSLAAVGLLVLIGAVYGVKRKADDNSKQISINRDTLRQKFIRPIIGSNPKDILQVRLAKGEITLDEYDKIRSKLY